MAALAVFVLAPLPFGSVDRIWVLLWLMVLSASLATADYAGVRRWQARLIGLGLLAFGTYAAVAVLQLLPWDGPFVAPIWREAAALAGEPQQPRISTVATSPLVAIAPALLFAMAAFRAFVLATEKDRGRSISCAIGCAAVVYALYSAASLAVAPERLLWREKEAYLGSLTGTFINRNTAAIYFGGAAIIWLLALVHELRMRSSRSLGPAQNLRVLLRHPPRDAVIAAGCFLICFGAVAATGSRAGFILTIVMLLLAVSLMVDWWSAIRRAGWWRLAAWAAAFVLLIELWGGGVAGRIDQRGLADAGRFEVYRLSLGIIAEHPVFGIGLGAFESFFPSRRSAALGSAGIWDRAHSTPLEIAVEMGLPMAVLLLAVFAASLVALGRASLKSRRRSVITGFCVGLLGVLHSSVDFSLQIPGYAVTFAALTAAGLAGLGLAARDRRRTPGEAPRRAGAEQQPLS